MPSVAITSANSGKGGEAGPYVEPHKRKDGPWADHELEYAGETMSRADDIRGNPKMMEAMAAHHKKKAKHHSKMAESMKRGLVSESALSKVSGRG